MWTGMCNSILATKQALGKKYIARQKLCSPGVTEYWVNNQEGMPYLVITGQVNEKLQEMLTEQVVPQIKKLVEAKQTDQDKAKDADTPLFTIVFESIYAAFFVAGLSFILYGVTILRKKVVV